MSHQLLTSNQFDYNNTTHCVQGIDHFNSMKFHCPFFITTAKDFHIQCTILTPAHRTHLAHLEHHILQCCTRWTNAFDIYETAKHELIWTKCHLITIFKSNGKPTALLCSHQINTITCWALFILETATTKNVWYNIKSQNPYVVNILAPFIHLMKFSWRNKPFYL